MAVASGAIADRARVRTTCRSCGGRELECFLSLGEVPLANSFLTGEQLGQPELRFPLEVYFCRRCALVQLLHVVDPEVLFSHYLYRTGTNKTIVEHNERLAENVVRDLHLGANDLVVEVASNDGSLLTCFRRRGVRTLGVEPAKNIVALARQAGIATLEEFFDARVAERIRADYGPAAAVVANNVLAHVDATADFLAAAGSLLRPGGRVIIEVPYLWDMMDRLEYDTVYHEHLCYFSVTPLVGLFEQAGLRLDRVERVPIHGGSLRLWGKRADEGPAGESVGRLMGEERAAGFDVIETFRAFAQRVQANRRQLLGLLERLRGEGKVVAGYGAPAKGNTLLCYCGIGAERIPYTVDASPLKVGLFTPGSHIPILPVDTIFARRPDYVLLLAWNFADEIMDFLRPYHDRGGRFILPIPEPTIL